MFFSVKITKTEGCDGTHFFKFEEFALTISGVTTKKLRGYRKKNKEASLPLFNHTETATTRKEYFFYCILFKFKKKLPDFCPNMSFRCCLTPLANFL